MLALLQTLQLLDSAFPTGAFAQSFGLETCVQQGRVRSAAQLLDYLGHLLQVQVAPLEGRAVWLVYQRQAEGTLTPEWLCRIDRLLVVQRMAQESREGMRKMGKRYLDMLMKLHAIPALQDYRELIQSKRALGHPAVVHALAMQGLGVSREQAVLTFFYSALNVQTANGVRLIPLGQTDGQRVLTRLFPLMLTELEQMEAAPPQGEQDLYSAGTWFEIDAMAHEQLYSRLFMS